MRTPPWFASSGYQVKYAAGWKGGAGARAMRHETAVDKIRRASLWILDKRISDVLVGDFWCLRPNARSDATGDE